MNPPSAHAAPRQQRARRDDLRLSPESGVKPAAGQKVRTEITKPPTRRALKTAVVRKQFNTNPVFPVYAGPLLPAKLREGIKRSPCEGRARRQSRTGHGRTRHRDCSPGPPAYPPLPLECSCRQVPINQGGSHVWSSGSHCAANPARLFSLPRPACQGGWSVLL